jgi:hypothetical protein
LVQNFETLDFISQGWMVIFGCAAIWLLGRREEWRRWGYVTELVSQPAWLLSSPVGLGSDKLLVHVSLDSGSVELFDIRIITVNKCINLRPAVISCLPAADLLDGPQVDDGTA